MHQKNCGELIKQIYFAMQKNANNELREADLTFAQVHLLFILKRQTDGQCTLKEVERQMGVAQSTTVGIVKRCGEKGFVECFEASADRRAKFVRITAKGLEICRDTEEKILRTEARLLKNLNEEERETIIQLLTKVYLAVSDSPESA